MKKEVINRVYLILIRYIVILGFVFSLPIIYKILTPLTVYPVGRLLDLVYQQVIISGNSILINNNILVELIPACIAGSAYVLLLILNLSTPMRLKKRIYSIVFSFISLLIINILRIVILSIMYYNGNSYFDITHKLFWYGLSIIFVIGIWFLTVKLFSIKDVPVYTDVKYLMKGIKKG